MLQNVTLAFLFNGIGIPVAATGLVYPVWAMAAMAVVVPQAGCNHGYLDLGAQRAQLEGCA